MQELNASFLEGYKKALLDIDTILEHRKSVLQEPYLKEAMSPKLTQDQKEELSQRAIFIDRVIENARTGIRLACKGYEKQIRG